MPPPDAEAVEPEGVNVAKNDVKKDPDANVEDRGFDLSGSDERVWECVSCGLFLGCDDMTVVCDCRRGGEGFVIVVVGCWERDVNINAGRSRFATVVCVSLLPTHLIEIIRNEIPLVRTELGAARLLIYKDKKN